MSRMSREFALVLLGTMLLMVGSCFVPEDPVARANRAARSARQKGKPPPPRQSSLLPPPSEAVA